MLISDKKEFIFFHISKTAGSSMRAALTPYSISTPKGRWHSILRRFDLPHDYHKFKFATHTFLSDAEKKLPVDIYKSYFKFAVVRNPWDRLVSGYHSEYGLKPLRNPNKKYKKPIGFNNYIVRQCKRKNFQIDRITNAVGEVDLDFMLRFECLDTDIKSLEKKLGFEIVLPHKNRSNREKPSYQDYFDQEMKNYVYKHWAKDIELLEYEF